MNVIFLKKYIVALLLSVVSLSSMAESSITSCDGSYIANFGKNGIVKLRRNGVKTNNFIVDHDISGGGFSPGSLFLALYRLPKNIDEKSPQANIISVYSVDPLVLLVKKNYGSGVYGAEFSVDNKFVVVTSRFGVDVIDLKKMESHFFDPAYTPDFALQQCGSNQFNDAISRSQR